MNQHFVEAEMKQKLASRKLEAAYEKTEPHLKK